MKKILHAALMMALPAIAMAGISNPAFNQPRQSGSLLKVGKTAISNYSSKAKAHKASAKTGAEASSLRMNRQALAKAPALSYDGKWQPQKVEAYSYYYQQWILEATNRYQYGEGGRLSHEWYSPADYNSEIEYVYSYDDSGRLLGATVLIDGETIGKVEVTYDDVVPGQVIGQVSYYVAIDGSYKLNDGWTSEITRDAEGRVTEVVISEVDDGKMYPEDRYVVTYGQDGVASEIITYENYADNVSPKWEEEMRMTDIVWDRTDSQFFFTPIDLGEDVVDDLAQYSNPEYFSGANRISSAKATYTDDWPMSILAVVEYSAEKDYEVHMTMGGIDMTHLKVTFTDDFGSMDVSLMTILDMEDGMEYDDDMEYEYESLEVRFDQFGLLTLLSVLELDEDPDLEPYDSMTLKGDVAYNAEFGYPDEVTYSQIYNDKEVNILGKNVYSDYTSLSGVSAITAEDSEARIFNLQGIPVSADSLLPGIYIVKTQSGTSKIIVP